MDKNKDGVVTLDEFIESCQEVRINFFLPYSKEIVSLDFSLSKCCEFFQTESLCLILLTKFNIPCFTSEVVVKNINDGMQDQQTICSGTVHGSEVCEDESEPVYIEKIIMFRQCVH